MPQPLGALFMQTTVARERVAARELVAAVEVREPAA